MDSVPERAALVERLQAGKRRARRERPQRLREVEAKMRELGDEFRQLPEGHARRSEIIRELRPLGEQRVSLRASLDADKR
jgi:hypothetical protein